MSWTTVHRAVEYLCMLAAGIALVVALLSIGCTPGLGVEVGSADVHSDRLTTRRGSGIEYRKGPDGSESFRAWRDDDAKNEGNGAGVRGGLRAAGP